MADLGNYDFKQQEARWGAYWLERGTYAWDPAVPRAETYVIDTPPPTVSGVLHIGHVFSYSQTDLLARYQRMSGKNVFYPIGFDDNGLPTERLVEKVRKVRAADMPREAFVALCHEVAVEVEKDFRALFGRIALSVDWSTLYETISPLARKISQMSLLDLYAKGHLYRTPQPTLWDPTDRTALAQAEIVEKEQTGTMYHLPFGIDDGPGVTIATTRPELLAACIALMCHPEDPRARDLIGRTAYTPLFEAAVPVIADTKVDPEKGTGFVMCCTFGDPTDIEWWREHKLPLRIIVGNDGRLTAMDGIGGPDWPSRDPELAHRTAAEITGLNVRKARGRMVELLAEAGKVLREEQVTQIVPCAERSGTPLEILVTAQWMVRLLDKKDLLIRKGRDMEWHPPFMLQRYEDWVTNLKWDWCISRQRYFGVPIPAWYSRRPGEEGKILMAHPDDLPVNPLATPPRGYAMEEVEPDPDVMDTWATSSVSPQINSRAINAEFAIDYERHRKLFPADLRPQAHEIIRTWAFYTVTKAALHEGVAPFRHMAISGWCLAEDRSKMSKSKGNTVTPERVLGTYGADVVRYWTASARLGRDTAFSEDVLKVGKRLVTKLWNASRFAGGHIDGFEPTAPSAAAAVAAGTISETLDLWILSRLAATAETATRHFEDYDYTDALATIERFFWADFCDNYLELVKGRAYGEVGQGPAARLGAQTTLYFSLRGVLALFAPFLPYVTEQIYSTLFPADFARTGSVHARGSWPRPADLPRDAAAEARGNAAVDVLSAVRKMKSTHSLSMKATIRRLLVSPGPAETAGSLGDLEGTLDDLLSAINGEAFAWSDAVLDGGDVFDSESGAFRVLVELAAAKAEAAG